MSENTADLQPMSVDPKDYSFLVRATFFRPVSVLMLFLAFLVVGLVAYSRVPLQWLPGGLSSGRCGVFIPVPDATPREVMEQVAKPCEDFLRTLPGLKEIVSSSHARRCFIRMEFDPKYDMGLLVAEIRDRVDRARASWPEGVDRYFLWRHSDSEMPSYIVSLGLGAESDDVDIDYLFDEVIQKRLEAVTGVARVQIWGLEDKRVEISLDKEKVDAYGIDLRRVIERLGADNQDVNAGTVIDGDREILVRFAGRFRSFEDVLDFPVGDHFRVRDFAGVRYSRSVRDRLARVNGQLSKAVVVYKESGANAVDVCSRVRQAFQDLEEELARTVPGLGRIESHAWLDQGEMISTSVASLRETGLFGGLCAMLVLFLFFRRPGLTLLVTLAIPFSLLIAVGWIFFSGGSFNLLSLMGLSLGIGMLVDNSIVVVESILRKMEEGYPPRRAAIQGVREVGLAVSLATLTTVLVFLPIIFLGDPRFRAITSEIGMPLCVSVLGSLLVALVFIPQGAIYLQRARARQALLRSFFGRSSIRRMGFLRRSVRVMLALDEAGAAARLSAFNRATAATLEFWLRHRVEAFVMAVGLLITTFWAFQLIPKQDAEMEGPRRLQMRLELPPNFTLSEANATFAKVEKAIKEATSDLGIKSITAWFDARGGELNVFPDTGARIREEEFYAKVRPHLPRLSGVTYHLGFEDFARDRGGQRLRVFLQGNDYDRLEDAALIVRRTLEDRERFPELKDVARWHEDERDEVRVQVERRAAQHFGIDTAMVSRMVAWALRGAPLPDFAVEDREYPFWIRYSDADKESVEELNAIRVYRPSGQGPVRLDSLAHYSMLPSAGDIHRRDGKMTVGFSAHVEAEDTFAVRKNVHYHLRRLSLPAGCEILSRPPRGGFEQDLERTFHALFLAFCLVFFVMGLLFESWILPLSVLLTIPFAFFGSAWFLYFTGIRLDGVGLIGTLMLVGIVVNNAIVLVDYINRLRSRMNRRREAILTAVQVRFRPIWMTALTTIFGLLPLLVLPQRGEGVDYKALAAVLVGGLMTSTFFTLFMVPLLYSVLDDLRRTARLLVGWKRGGARARGTGAGL